VATVVLATSFLTGGAALAAGPASASQWTGPVDAAGWCTNPNRDVSMYGGVAIGARATNAKNAYSWECTTYNWLHQVTRQSGVDMNSACAYSWGRGVKAGLWDSKNAYSWYCHY
jgi:hypothetical protein